MVIDYAKQQVQRPGMPRMFDKLSTEPGSSTHTCVPQRTTKPKLLGGLPKVNLPGLNHNFNEI